MNEAHALWVSVSVPSFFVHREFHGNALLRIDSGLPLEIIFLKLLIARLGVF